MRAEHPESNRRQVGHKRRQVGDKRKIMRAEHPERTGRQGATSGDKWETHAKIMQAEHPKRTSSKITSPETHVKSRGPRIHPFQRSKNPSQVNLFGELPPLQIRGCVVDAD